MKNVSFVESPVKLKSRLDLDYVGFPISDVFVVGYGLDLGQLYRNFPDIQVLDK